MTQALVGYAWLAKVDSPAKRALLGTLALHADLDASGAIAVEELAKGAAMSVRSTQTHLHELAADCRLTWRRQRSTISGRYQPTEFALGYPFEGEETPSANMSGSELPMAELGKYSSIRFDPQRVNPAWAWRVDVPTAAHRVVLGSVALLSDHRGVCLAPRTTIAQRSLLSLGSTNRVLGDLEKTGWIGRETRRRGARAAEGRLYLTRDFLTAASPTEDDDPVAINECQAIQKSLIELEGLPALIAAACASNWRGATADHLAQLLTDLISGSGRWVALRRVDFKREDAIADTISLAWTVLIEHTEAIINAADPTGLLMTIVGRQAARQDQIARGIVRTNDGPVATCTLATEWELDQIKPARDLDQRGNDVGLDDLADSPMMDTIVAQLATIGIDPGLAWPVLCRCAELAVKEPASRRHTAARRDPYLAILGLTPDAASAWMNIITGTRRAGAEASPLLMHPESILATVPTKWLDAILAA